MALVNCKGCGEKISKAATACPKCGHPVPKKTSILTFIVGGLFTLMVAQCVFTSATKNEEPSAATAYRPPAVIPQPSIADKEINTVLAGAQMLKNAMKKPETFELLKAGMIDGKVICYEYRARNSFNDNRVERYVVTDSVSSGKEKDWNKFCAGKSATDYTSVRAVLR